MWLSLRFRQVASAAEVQSLRRFTVCLASQSAAADTGRRRLFGARSPERRDETACLGRQDSNSEMSWQNIPLKGHTDFQGSSRILATETIRV